MTFLLNRSLILAAILFGRTVLLKIALLLSMGAEIGVESSFNQFSILGDLTLDSGSTVNIELGGTDPALDCDQISVESLFQLLGGDLIVVLESGFSPVEGDSFPILDFGNIEGSFDSIQLPPLSANLEWDDSELLANGIISVASSDPMTILGDMNGDGKFDNLDINPFVLALTDPTSFAAQFPSVDTTIAGDFNEDGVFDNLDISGFVAALSGGV